jgi:hypothetical protein
MKKTKHTELDVDFIGSQEPLTMEEKKKLNEYFSKIKNKKSKASKKKELAE